MSLVVLLYQQSGCRMIAVAVQFGHDIFCHRTRIKLEATEDEWNCVISINYTFTACVVTFRRLVVISHIWAGLSTAAVCCLVFSPKVRAIITIQTRRRICAGAVPCTVSNPTSYRTLGPSIPLRVATIYSQNWESRKLEISTDQEHITCVQLPY